MKQDPASRSPVHERQFGDFTVGALALVLAAACGQPVQSPEAQARAGLAAIRARPGSPRVAGPAHILATAGTLVPQVTATSGAVTARVVLPSRANGQIHVEDAATGAGIDIALVGATNSVAQVVDGYVVYPKGQASGSIYELAEPSGVEDYVAFDVRPASPSIAYDVSLGSKVVGLRLVGNQLEMLDSSGAPRLRVAPPSIVGAAGEQADALLAVEGCAVDTNPAGPWGRTVTPPGAKRCRVRISWAADAVSYPALLDPRWQTTGSLSVARQDHNLIYLPLTGKVLAVGGRSSPTSTTGLSSAELYDKNSGTWSATSSMSGGRWSASATLLGSSSNGTTSQKVLIAGGINGSTSLTTAQLYNQTAGTWAAAGTLNTARHLHTATLLNDGRVLVCGGMNGSTVLTSAALYNPASGSGSWAATTGPIPPAGWRSGTATLIATANQQLNGKVLLSGGNDGTNTLSAVFLFDPAQSAFSTLASMPSPREGHQAVVLSDGRILVAGGKSGSTYLASSVIFDPSWGPGNWTAAGNMTSARWGHAMNLLPSGVLHLGLVLVSGGSNGTSTLSSTEYWNGTNWATDGVMVAPVQQHGSVAIGNSILIAGGAINNGSTTVSAAEVYDPSIALGCTSGSQCASGFCVSGVCCDSACNGGCGSCNLTGHLGICTPLTSGSVCRALAGSCDAAETCDGSSLACPNDVFQPSTTVCRASAGSCDVAETCTGTSVTCPVDAFQPATTVCRPAVGACDRAENCTGSGASCPADLKTPDGTACNDGNACTRNDICTAGSCGGTAYTCNDGLACTADTCNGDGTCTYVVAAGSCAIDNACHAAGADNPGNQCQQCTPGSSQTAWSPKPAGTACNDGNACTKNDVCNGASACTGTAYTCNDGLACTTDSCNGDGSCSFALLAGNCLIAGGCYADGAVNPTNQCQQCTPSASGTSWNPKANGTACSDGNACTKNDVCTAGTCAGTAYSCDDGLACTADSCNGDGSCGHVPLAGNCAIQGTCYTQGATNQTNDCQLCDPAQPTAWSNQSDGTACDDGNGQTQNDVCTMGKCQGTTPCAIVDNMSAGGTHTCAVRSDGSLWCWGSNIEGQLGDGTAGSPTNGPVRAGNSTWNWKLVTTGHDHTCAIRRDGTLWCWGSNSYGQLGNGAADPAAVPTPTQVAGEGWTAVRASSSFTCGVRGDGSLWCWGKNESGNLGNGSTDNSPVPVEVVGTNWVSLAVGDAHACGIQGDRSLWCWGANGRGQLGNGSTAGSATPVQVGDASWSNVTTDVTSGAAHTCGLRLDNSLWCWGANDDGALGNGSTTDSSVPVKVGSESWMSESGGSSYTCGVQGDATLWCWGLNDTAQLGDWTLQNRLSPVRILGQNWLQVSAGETHACGLRSGGSLWCWGFNQDDEVGDGTNAMRNSPVQVVGDLCSSVPICGNGNQEAGEECDDGNTTSGDGCTWDCKKEWCYGIVCPPASDQCHNPLCDPTNGQCSEVPKPDGEACEDGDLCTLADTCIAGACTAGSPKDCGAATDCFEAGTCDPSSGACSNKPIDKVGCNVHLQSNGVVNMGDGTFRAIFGYTSSASGNVHPTTNQLVLTNTGEILHPTPPPPTYLAPNDPNNPNSHVGAFLPSFQSGQTIRWQVDGEHVDASETSRQYTPQTVGTGQGVDLGGGTVVMITPDLSPYLQTPADPAQNPEALPTGDEFKATLAGQLTVGPTGAATYTVPIGIPPGIAGMAPNLNLVYNSQGGDGIAGQGWELTGLSAIHRCPKTRVQDGYAQPVQADSTPVYQADGDGVCLDGKRLFLIPPTPGPPGAPPPASGDFNTEMADFSQIHFALDTFTVTTKSGEIRNYGSKGTSRVQLWGGAYTSVPVPGDGAIQVPAVVTEIWALDKVEDPWGNYYEIEYNNGQQDYLNRGLIVTSIKYTGHEGSGAVTSPFYQVTFGYEPRPDLRSIRFAQATLPKNQRLTSIATDRGTYALTYKPDDDPMLPSRLWKIGYCTFSDPAECTNDLVFDWDGGGYQWDPEVRLTAQDVGPSHQYGLPCETNGIGIQFVDLDGDGRVDLVQANLTGSLSNAWRNTGSGWEKRDDWKLPSGVYLAQANDDGSQKTLGTRFADFDGDGLPDLISVATSSNNGNNVTPGPFVWLNRLKSGGGWGDPVARMSGSYLTALLGGDLDLTTDQLADMDGDGKADLVRFGSSGAGQVCTNWIEVLRSTGSSWSTAPSYNYSTVKCEGNFRLFDLNRDGLPDLIGPESVINTGDTSKGDNGTVWKSTTLTDQDPDLNSNPKMLLLGTGDIDGDGMYDRIYQRVEKGQQVGTACDWSAYEESIRLAVGVGWWLPTNDQYVPSLSGYAHGLEGGTYTCGSFPSPFDGVAQMADLNADGLADVVVAHLNGTGVDWGQLMTNTGSQWRDIDGFTSASDCETHFTYGGDPTNLHRHLVPHPAAIFVDLDGDGVTDRISEKAACTTSNGTTTRTGDDAWLNNFKPPVITGFPNGRAQNTTVSYSVISTADAQTAHGQSPAVYSDTSLDTGSLDPGTKYYMLPLRVAALVTTDNGVGGTSTASYQYQDLRASSAQRGPQGFKKVIATETSGNVTTTTTTTYAQAFPYTGMPTSVTRDNKGTVTQTVTLYCDNANAGGDPTECTPPSGFSLGQQKNNIFVYPMTVTDTSYLRDSSEAPPDTSTPNLTTTTTTTYDAYGNPTVTVVTLMPSSGLGSQKTVTNSYGSSGSPEQLRDKVTRTTVTTLKLASDGSIVRE